MKKIILAIIILGVSVGILVALYANRKSETSVAKEKPSFELKAEVLLEQFEKDESTANGLYLNKVIQIEGCVSKIEETKEGINLYLKGLSPESGIICGFNKRNIDVSDYSEGKPVVVKGLCTGYLFDVVLVKCSLVEQQY